MKKNVYSITGSLCCTAEINTTLEINYTSTKKMNKSIKQPLRYNYTHKSKYKREKS